jgi:hypothetical protein
MVGAAILCPHSFRRRRGASAGQAWRGRTGRALGGGCSDTNASGAFGAHTGPKPLASPNGNRCKQHSNRARKCVHEAPRGTTMVSQGEGPLNNNSSG